MSVEIEVTKRSDHHYAACLVDNRSVWESGRTEMEAIGKLVIAAGNLLGITAFFPDKKKKKKK